jgi:hypothetical protein
MVKNLEGKADESVSKFLGALVLISTAAAFSVTAINFINEQGSIKNAYNKAKSSIISEYKNAQNVPWGIGYK